MKAPVTYRQAIMLAGIATAASIAVFQLFCFQPSDTSTVKAETEQPSQTPAEGETAISLPSSFSMPSSANVVLGHEFAFIEELISGDERDEAIPEFLQLSSRKLFRTLFHYIISPNAP